MARRVILFSFLPVADGSVESALLFGTPAARHNFYISVLPLQKAVAFAGSQSSMMRWAVSSISDNLLSICSIFNLLGCQKFTKKPDLLCAK